MANTGYSGKVLAMTRSSKVGVLRPGKHAMQERMSEHISASMST
jgi:hypothetical protein